MIEDEAIIGRLLHKVRLIPPASKSKQLRSVEAAACIERIFDKPLGKRGFTSMSPFRWVRAKHGFSHEVIALSRLKGGSLSPCWGVSFDFIPELVGRQFRVRKRPKFTPFHLHEDPLDFPEFQPTQRADVWMLDTLAGEEHLANSATRILPLIEALSERWFRSCRTLDAAAEMFEYWQRRPYIRLTYANYVDSPFAHACILARLGDLPRAMRIVEPYRRRLDREYAGHPLRSVVLKRMDAALLRCGEQQAQANDASV